MKNFLKIVLPYAKAWAAVAAIWLGANLKPELVQFIGHQFGVEIPDGVASTAVAFFVAAAVWATPNKQVS